MGGRLPSQIYGARGRTRRPDLRGKLKSTPGTRWYQRRDELLPFYRETELPFFVPLKSHSEAKSRIVSGKHPSNPSPNYLVASRFDLVAVISAFSQKTGLNPGFSRFKTAYML